MATYQRDNIPAWHIPAWQLTYQHDNKPAWQHTSVTTYQHDNIPAWQHTSVTHSSVTTYQREKDKKSSDVTDHPTEGYLERTEDFEGRHQVGCPGNAEDVCDGEQDVRHDLWVVRFPLKTRCWTTDIDITGYSNMLDDKIKYRYNRI